MNNSTYVTLSDKSSIYMTLENLNHQFPCLIVTPNLVGIQMTFHAIISSLTVKDIVGRSYITQICVTGNFFFMFDWINIWLLWYSVFYSLLDSVCYKAILVRSTLTLFSLYWVSFFIALGQFLPFFSLYWVILPFFSLYWVVLPSFHYIGSVFTLFLIALGRLPFLYFIGSVFFALFLVILGHFALFSLYWASFYPFSHYIGSFCPFFISLGQFYPFLVILRTLFLPRYISMMDFIKCSCEMVRYGNFYINGHNLLNNLFL